MHLMGCFKSSAYVAKISGMKKKSLWYFINGIIGFQVLGFSDFVACLEQTALRFHIELAD